jgi:hypothetical protein
MLVAGTQLASLLAMFSQKHPNHVYSRLEEQVLKQYCDMQLPILCAKNLLPATIIILICRRTIGKPVMYAERL